MDADIIDPGCVFCRRDSWHTAIFEMIPINYRPILIRWKDGGFLSVLNDLAGIVCDADLGRADPAQNFMAFCGENES